MITKYGLSISLLVCTSSFAVATEYRDMIYRAYQAVDGKYAEELSGPVPDMIRAQINRPDAIVRGEVTTLETLAEEGCKRFNLRIYTPGTYLPLEDGKTSMLDMSIKLNMCADRLPPKSS